MVMEFKLGLMELNMKVILFLIYLKNKYIIIKIKYIVQLKYKQKKNRK
jgi:hypothetical protein